MIRPKLHRPVVIMAAGVSRRWHADYPKQLALVDGEPVLYRTVRQLRSRGIEPVITARYHGQWNLFNEHISTPNECEIDRIWGAREFSPASYLYGDCCYTDQAIEAILSDTNEWRFFGRWKSSRIKIHAEIFAVKTDAFVMEKCRQLRDAHLKKLVPRALALDLYGMCLGIDLPGWRRAFAFHETAPTTAFTSIDDGTEDFDTVEEYQRFISWRSDKDSRSQLMHHTDAIPSRPPAPEQDNTHWKTGSSGK